MFTAELINTPCITIVPSPKLEKLDTYDFLLIIFGSLKFKKLTSSIILFLSFKFFIKPTPMQAESEEFLIDLISFSIRRFL